MPDDTKEVTSWGDTKPEPIPLAVMHVLLNVWRQLMDKEQELVDCYKVTVKDGKPVDPAQRILCAGPY